MAGYYIGIDQGTTNTTAVLVDENWQIKAKASKAHKQIYPKPGWVEHDPFEVYGNIKTVVQEIMNMVPGVNAADIKGLGLDHQGETCVIWDKKTGEPIYNAIVWQDRRTSDIAEKFKLENGKKIKEI